MRLLAKDPAERPASASEVVSEVRRIRESSMEPVAVPVEVATDAQRLGGEWGRFVGRSEELGELKAAFDAALGGRAGLVMVVGEPGIGKTRLVEELSAYQRGARRAGVLGALVRGRGRGSIPPVRRSLPHVRA